MVSGESVHISIKILTNQRASFHWTDGAVERVNVGGVKTCTKIIAGCAHDEKSEDRFGGDSDVFDVCGDQSSNFEHKFLDDTFRKISNSIQGVNSHVVRDITSKPPSTIEWE
ncbi:unnamed protein product [Brassica rapa subsp. trilocularis]